MSHRISLYPNGYEGPVIQIWTDAGKIDEFIFPECNEDGFLERHSPVQLEKTIIDYSLKHEPIGVRLEFILNYNRYFTYLTWTKFATIYNKYWKKKKLFANLKIILIPHAEVRDRFFNVAYTGDPIEIKNFKGGSFALGARGLIIKFTTIELLDEMNAVNAIHDNCVMMFPFPLIEV